MFVDPGCVLEIHVRTISAPVSPGALGAGRGSYISAISGVFGLSPQGKKAGVHNVHTPGFGPGRTGAGLCRIPYVSSGVQCLQGLEPGSSPTSGTVDPLVRGVSCFNACTLTLRGSL